MRKEHKGLCCFQYFVVLSSVLVFGTSFFYLINHI